MTEDELHLNETVLLETIIRHRDIYMAVSELGIEPWFFKNEHNAKLFTEFRKISYQRAFTEIKSVLIAKNNENTRYFNNIMLSKRTVYREMFDDDDYLFINFVSNYRDERHSERFRMITLEIERRMRSHEPYQDLIAEIDELQPTKAKNDLMGFDSIVDAIDNEVYKNPYPTGIDSLDKFVKIVDSYLWVISGESSSGKTSFANQVVYNFYRETDYNTLYFSLETTQVRLGNRFMRMIEMAENTDSHGAKECSKKIGDRITVTKDEDSIEGIEKIIRTRQKEDDRLKFIVVDYLQIVNVKAKGYEDETPKVAYVIKKLHKLAQQLNLVMVVLSQLKKETYNKKGGEMTRSTPTMSDLRGSSQIVNSADVITINWFKEVHVSQKDPCRKIKIQVVKNKDSSQGGVNLLFMGANFWFVEEPKDV